MSPTASSQFIVVRQLNKESVRFVKMLLSFS